MSATDWTCADCGSPGAHPIEHPKFGTFAKFDERYTTGYCDHCTVAHPKTPRKTPRKRSRLVRTDAFDREAWIAHREKLKLKELIQMVSGRDVVQMTDQMVVDLVRLYDKHGAPGFYLPESTRDQYNEILKSRR